jgi:hypothetical protein
MERLHPRQTRKDRFAHPNKTNASGRNGVRRLDDPSRRRDGGKQPCIYWVATTPRWIKPPRTRFFSVAKYGEEEAYRLAVAAREVFEAEVGEAANKALSPEEVRRHPPPLRCIRRHEGKETGGWTVHITRSASDRIGRKTFSDSRHGGKASALAAAQAWRDEIERQHPKQTPKQQTARLTVRNTSGKSGVHRITRLRPRVDGSEYVVFFWQAKTPKGVQPFRSRSFSTEKYGEQEAYRLAMEARLAFEALLDDS